ncbi:MAG TPA: type III pantothenate kinase [Woeseiaceae bacterium]|nr:type III pantothenate kinase [Woeseiaceae bacterium]
MKALLLDVGNTRLKWGVLEDDRIHRTGHIAMRKIREEGLGVLTSRLPRNVEAVHVSNVAGATFATRLSGVIGMHCGCDVHFAKSEREACGVRSGYRHPRRLGVDRWVAMIGARAELESACIVVDAGTAVTIDALDDEGRHLGGQIFPGVRLMFEALTASTSDIPAVGRQLSATSGLDMFGDSTSKAVQNGAWNAVAGAVDRAITTLRSNAYDPAVVLTGGDASRMLTALGTEPLHRPHLVLQGLARMLQDTPHER